MSTGIECCYCWKIDTYGAYNSPRWDLHEIILSRGAVRGTDSKTMEAIMTQYNCGFVHQDTCHKMAEGGDGRMRGILYLLRYEGFTNVWNWLKKIDQQDLLQNMQEFKYDVLLAQAEMERCLGETLWKIWKITTIRE